MIQAILPEFSITPSISLLSTVNARYLHLARCVELPVAMVYRNSFHFQRKVIG